jgi:hypothetical protein
LCGWWWWLVVAGGGWWGNYQLTILISVIPLLKQCSVTLALRAPAHLQKDIDKAVLKATPPQIYSTTLSPLIRNHLFTSISISI